MSRMYQTKVTLTIDGVEADRFVRAWVNVEPGLGMGGGWGAEIDGDVEVLLPEGWLPLENESDERDVQSATEALCDLALSDDSDACALEMAQEMAS